MKAKTFRKITAKRRRNAQAVIDRAHELVVAPERLEEDVMLYTANDGQPRVAILDHSHVSEGR